MFTTCASGAVGRRGFLRQSFAFSALATFGPFPALADALATDRAAAHLLMLGDWGEENPAAQPIVARGMRRYSKEHALLTQALLLLGDNWYGELSSGVRSPRWQTPNSPCEQCKKQKDLAAQCGKMATELKNLLNAGDPDRGLLDSLLSFDQRREAVIEQKIAGLCHP